uniref:Uncharacterized protein n=1 Tax=viral metagenome TaxID=1070528 RepID=A0A6C0KE13_9ZZZZ|tara:strand:- start:71 stop:508 length:438 start_codon:yes stop_codon:yes gene_type:complete
MENMFKSVMKSNHHLVLTILLCVFIVFDIQVPGALANMIDNPIGKISVAALSLCLLSMNTLLGVIGLVAAYVLIQRSANTTGTQAEKDYLPSEAKKKAVLSAMNQFPVTVEEEVIAKMLPMNNQVDLSESEFKPVLGDTHNADKC